MAKTILFYKPIIYINNKATTIHITEMIDKIYPISPKANKNKVVNRKTTSLITHKIPSLQANHPNDRIFSLAIYRENKPFIGEKGQDTIEEIDKDVLELTTCVYFASYRLLTIEYNHHGCRPPRVQDYFNMFLPSDETTNWSIQFIPLEPKLGLSDVLNSDEITKISFDLDLSASSRTNINSMFDKIEEPSVKNGVLATVLEHMLKIQEEIGGNKSKFEIGNGRKKSNTIDYKELIKVLSHLNLEEEIFSSIIVNYKSKKTGKKETTDLKNAGVLKEILDIDGTGWEYIGDTINDFFFAQNRPGSNVTLDEEKKLYEEKLPKLVL